MSLSILSSMDFFSIFPGFFVKRDLDYKTRIGGFITILIIILTIALASIFSLELFLKKDPNVSTALKINEHPNTYQYPYPIFFMLAVRDSNDIPIINEKIYFPEGYIFKSILENGKVVSKKYQVNMVSCDKIIDETFQYYNLIENIDLKNHYCLDNTNNDLSIGEFWGNENFTMLQVKMFKCSNESNKVNCENENFIKDFLSDNTVQIYSIKNYLNSNDHKNPLNTGIEENFYYILEGFHTTVFHYLRELEIKDDDGLIFLKENIIKSFTVDSERNFINLSTKQNKFFSFAIQLTNTKEIYSRSYFKLQDLGAQVSSFYSIFMVVGSVILKFYHKSEYCLDLLNDFFEIDASNININKISNHMKKAKDADNLVGKSTIDDLYSKISNKEIKLNRNKINNISLNISNIKNELDLDDTKNNNPIDNNLLNEIKYNFPINNNCINTNKQSNNIAGTRRMSCIQKPINYWKNLNEIKGNYKINRTSKKRKSISKNSYFISNNFRGKLKNPRKLSIGHEKIIPQNILKNDSARINTITNEDEKLKDYISENSFDLDKILTKCQKTSKKIKLSFWDRLIGIEFCDKYLKRKSKFYKNYYLGQEYFMQTLEVSVFLKDMNIQNNFVKFYLTEEQYKIFKYVSQPILNMDYVGTRYDRNNIPNYLADKLGFKKES